MYIYKITIGEGEDRFSIFYTHHEKFSPESFWSMLYSCLTYDYLHKQNTVEKTLADLGFKILMADEVFSFSFPDKEQTEVDAFCDDVLRKAWLNGYETG